MTSGNPAFDQLLDDMRAIHARKAHDYANDANRYQNFEYAARVSELLTDPVDRVFATLIGVKIGRIGELTREGKEAKNEAVEDSFLDLATYAALWASYRKRPEGQQAEAARAVVPDGSPTRHPPGAFVNAARKDFQAWARDLAIDIQQAEEREILKKEKADGEAVMYEYGTLELASGEYTGQWRVGLDTGTVELVKAIDGQ